MKTEPTGLIPGTTEELGRVKAGVHTPDSDGEEEFGPEASQ